MEGRGGKIEGKWIEDDDDDEDDDDYCHGPPPRCRVKMAPKRSRPMFMGVFCISKGSRSVAGRSGISKEGRKQRGQELFAGRASVFPHAEALPSSPGPCRVAGSPGRSRRLLGGCGVEQPYVAFVVR
jgi:hypothetical protein